MSRNICQNSISLSLQNLTKMIVERILLVIVYYGVSVIDAGDTIKGTNIKKTPCLLKWEKCLAHSSKPTAAECDDFLYKKFNCPKPKSANKDRTGDYDYVIIREQEDTDHQEDLNIYKDNRNKHVKAEATSADDIAMDKTHAQISNQGNKASTMMAAAGGAKNLPDDDETDKGGDNGSKNNNNDGQQRRQKQQRRQDPADDQSNNDGNGGGNNNNNGRNDGGGGADDDNNNRGGGGNNNNNNDQRDDGNNGDRNGGNNERRQGTIGFGGYYT